jgi:hypothetical protein
MFIRQTLGWDQESWDSGDAKLYPNTCKCHWKSLTPEVKLSLCARVVLALLCYDST